MSTETFENIVARLKSDPTFKDYFLKEAIREGKELKLIHRLREVGFFKPSEKLRPQKKEDGYSIPYWDVAEFLMQAAKTNRSKPDVGILSDLKAIIEEVLSFDFGEFRNFYIDAALIEIIFRLPVDEIEVTYIEYLRVFLDKGWRQTNVSPKIGELVLPALISGNDKNKLLSALRIVLDYSHSAFEKDNTLKSIMDEYWLMDALKKNKAEILKLCGIEAAEIGIEIIEKIHSLDESEFNIVWVPSVEMSDQVSMVERYDYQLVSFVRDILVSVTFESLALIVKGLKESKIPILRRIAYHIIDERYDELSSLLWVTEFNPLKDTQCSHEIRRLLKRNSNSFNSSQLHSITAQIESYDFVKTPEDPEADKVYVAYKKKSWYKLLLPSGDALIQKKYDEYNEIYPEPITDADEFPIWMGPLERVNHVPVEEFSQKNDEELIEYLKEKIENNSNNESKRMNQSDSLVILVKANPHRFIAGFKKFIDLDSAFLYAIIRGISESLQNGERIEWSDFLDGVKSLFEDGHDFGLQSKDYNYKNWLIGDIAKIISFGSNNEELGYPLDLLPSVEQVLLSLLNFAENDYYNMRDVVTSVLNSTHGKLYAALIVCSLRYYRGFKNAGEYPGWLPKIKAKFILAVEDKNPESPDARVILAEYLPQLFFHLDKDFVTTRINEIFFSENEQIWRDTFGAYLVTSNVYDELFRFLNEQGFYERALAIILERDPREKLIDHITIGYFNGLDKTDQPLMAVVLSSKSYKDISRLIHFISWNEMSVLENYSQKILGLWDKINDVLDNESDRGSDFYDAKTRLLLWFKYFTLPDAEVKKRLLRTIKGMKDDFTVSRFLEILVKFVETDIHDVVDIFKYFLEQGVYPHYPDNSINLIFEETLKQGLYDDAQEILNRYSSKNMHMLKPLWDKYKSS